MAKLNFSYVVIDDDLHVCESIAKRMQKFENWNCKGLIASLNIAINTITEDLPELLFLDWSLIGGNAFMLLEKIETIENYQPFVIFFTGFQNDRPDIPVDLINRFKVNKYLVKPVFENLTNHLEEYVFEAENMFQSSPIQELWIEDINKVKRKIIPDDIICISQSASSRIKIIHTKNDEIFEIKASWDLCEKISKEYNLDYLVSKARETIINKKYITKIHKPYIWLNNRLKVEVTKDKWKDLESL